ncbi:MAG: aminotransferase class V-fold PLP-dependent enzyme [Candidatus Saccharicenans sp.]
MLNRREFIKSCAAGIGLAALTPEESLEMIASLSRSTAGMSPEQVAMDEDFWFQVRLAFTEDRNIINLNQGTIQPGLRIVQEAYRRHSEFSGNAGAHSMAILAREVESSRRRLAAHLGCDPEELVICRGGSEAGQIVLLGLDLKKGDEVITTNQDYPRLIAALKQREKREGIVLKMVKLPEPPVPMEKFYNLVAEQVTSRTRAILVCHLTHYTGQMAPIARLAELARSKGIELIVDGAHGFMHFPFKLSELGCDYYTASLHKWTMAPPGNGMVRIPKDRIPKLWPLTPPWTDDPNDIRRFEDVGTRSPASRAAIAEALTFNEGLGIERKAARLRYLTNRWVNRLKQYPQVKFYTSLNPGEYCGLVTFGIQGIDMGKLSEYLLEKHRIVTSHITHPDKLVDGIRIVVNVSLSVQEIDYFADVVEEVIKKGKIA